MSRFHLLRLPLIAVCACAVLWVCAATAQAAPQDQSYQSPPAYDASQSNDATGQAPGRVARLAYLSGQVQFAPAGENAWGSVEINRPMVLGDRLLTGDDGLAVLELGDASVRINHDSAFDFLNLDDNNVQIELSQGTLNLAVHQLDDGENFEIDTPTIAFVAAAPGVYRIDNNPDGIGSMVTVFRGEGTVYGENGASRQVAAGTSYRFNDSTLTSVDVDDLPQPDAFDRFCEARDANFARYAQQQQRYVPPDLIGGEDLDQYGRWNNLPEYGNVWYPTTVPAGWAPYRYGHWAWIDPWGWTWVGNEPWGFAPFHYGRWVYVRNRWGWVPGPLHARPAYAPALVAFIGGSGLSVSVHVGGGPIGWFPLGPRDVYVPWFHASRRYFTRVNVSNIRRVYVNRTVINNVYNNYSHHRYVDIRRHNHYAYRRTPHAVTAVPRDVFTGARPVHPAVLRVNHQQLTRAETSFRPGALPGRSSLGLRHPVTRPALLHDREPFVRPVVARHQPPPRPVAFTTREKLIARQRGRPLTTTQMRSLRQAHPTRQQQARVKLVPATLTTQVPPQRDRVAAGHAERPAKRLPIPVEREFHNQIHPIPAHQPSLPSRAGELPSARFRRADPPASLPHVPVLRAADAPPHTRLPVVKPLKLAPQRTTRRIDPQPDSRQFKDRQLRQQSMQQQRRLQQQAQQLLRPQQTQRPRATQIQKEQRARNLQLQQQRQQQTQMRQQLREQQARQQRQMSQARERAAQTTHQQQFRERAMQVEHPPRLPERPAQRSQPRSHPTTKHHPPPPRSPPASSGRREVP